MGGDRELIHEVYRRANLASLFQAPRNAPTSARGKSGSVFLVVSETNKASRHKNCAQFFCVVCCLFCFLFLKECSVFFFFGGFPRNGEPNNSFHLLRINILAGSNCAPRFGLTELRDAGCPFWLPFNPKGAALKKKNTPSLVF